MPSEKCPNGHPANSNGNCFDPNCPYRNSQRHKSVGDDDGDDNE